MNIQKVLLKVWQAIRDFVARHIDSGVAREFKKASCAALRSNASKNAFIKSSKNASRKACGLCTSRALLSLFVASATLLATFVIAPTYALSAGENTGENAGEKVSTEETVGAKAGSTKSEGEKQNPKQSESNNNTELNKKDTGSSSTLTNNKESNPVEKQNPASNNGANKPKSDETAVNKKVKDVQKKDSSTEAARKMDRSTKGEHQLHPACKGKYNTPEKCYSITYSKELSIKGSESEPYYKVPQIITTTIKVAGIVQQTLPNGVWLGLEKYGKTDDSVKYAFFKGENDNNDSYTAKSTEKVANSNGYIRFFASKWLKADKSYRFKVVIHYPDGSESKAKKIIARLAKDDLPKPKSDDLKLSLYDFENADSTAKKDNDNKSVSITIKPKSNTQGADKKDTYDPINKLFIDSKSIYKRGKLYHHMICKDDANNYTVDGFNGLSLKDKNDNPSADKQTQFEHKEGENRPSTGAADSALYEDDKYTEESQSWISGTPTSAGTFECRVFAFKNAELTDKASGKHPSNLVDQFKKNAETDAGKKSLFEGNIVDSNTWKTDDIKQGVDWDYKSVTIEVKSNKPPEPKPPKIGDNDLTLKVYPFNGSKTALTSDNNKISAMLGMELKPFVDATSAEDSKNKITLRVLCSKGEKKNNSTGSGTSTGGAGSSGGNTGDGSQPTQPSGSSQSAEDLEYKTWSSNLAELGLSVPADDNQNTCHSDKEGEKTCVSADSKTNVAARTDKEVTLKPTKVGDYQCVVFALKPKAFNAQSGKQTPADIDKALADDKSLKEHKDFAAFTLNIHLVSKFTLPHTGGQSWNLQLGILAALLVNLLAAGFVVSQSERGRKLILGRWRGLCNHV